MNYFLITLSLLFSVQCIGKQPDWKYYKAYPTYDSVWRAFSKSYNLREVETDSLKWNLTKRRDGWHVVLAEYYAPDNIRQDYLFWSAASKKYKKIPVAPEPVPDSYWPDEKPEVHGYLFDVLVYYGYKGWEKDILHDFGALPNVPDFIYENLSRAAFSCSNSFVDKSYLQTTDNDDLPLSSNQKADSVKYYLLKCIKYDSLLMRQNPAYEFLIGRADNRYINDIMHLWYELSLFNRGEEVRYLMKKGLYSDFMRNNAELYLKSCPANTIVFTGGDNDTYPLWYMQQVYGVRPDVRVINISLLNIPHYLAVILDTNRINPIRSSFNSYALSRVRSKYYYSVSKEKTGVFPQVLRDFAAQMQQGENAVLPYTFKADVTGCRTAGFYPAGLSYSATWFACAGSYTDFGHIAALDIMLNNFTEVPVCFSVSMTTTSFFSEKYFLQRGLVNQFCPAETLPHPNPIFGSGYVFIDAMKALLVNDSALYACPRPGDSNEKRFFTNLRVNYALLAKAEIESGDTLAAAKTLAYVQRHLLLDCGDAEPFLSFIVELMYQTNYIQEADVLARKQLDYLKAAFIEKDKDDNLFRLHHSVFMIREIAHKLNRVQVEQQANELLELIGDPLSE